MKFNDDIEQMLGELSDKERAQFEKEMSSLFKDNMDSFLEMSKNSITVLMSDYKVDDVKALCKAHDIKGYSNLNKDELLQHFIESLVDETYFKQEVAKMTKAQQLALVMTAEMNERFDAIVTPVQFDDTFLMFSIDEGHGYYSLHLPDEVSDKVRQYIQQDEHLRQMTLAYQLLVASSNLYGLFSYTQLQNVYRHYLGVAYSLVDIQNWLKRVEYVNPEMTSFRVVNGLIASKGLQFEEAEYPYFLKEAKYYMPETIDAFLTYEDNVYGIDDETEMNFMAWVEENTLKHNQSNVNAIELSVELLTMMKHAASFDMIQSILNSLVDDGVLRQRVKQTGKNVVKPIFMNMRSWMYHGYTVEEYIDLMNQNERHQFSNVIDFNQHRK
ncbi:hypothetical protein [Staphylococcus sp. 11261D007BR]